MQNRDIITLTKIAKILEDNGLQELSEELDDVSIRIALLHRPIGLRTLDYSVPGNKSVRRKLNIQPKNFLESLKFKIEDSIQKRIEKKYPNKKYTIGSFIDVSLQEYQLREYLNSDFILFLVKSPSFTEQVFRKISARPDLHDIWKKLFKDVNITLSEYINNELKKLDSRPAREANFFVEVLNYLLLLKEFLPQELTSEIKSIKEYLEQRTGFQSHIEDMSETIQEDSTAEEKAKEELERYKRIPEMEELQNIKNSFNHLTLTLIKIAKELDNSGQYKKADKFTKIAMEFTADHLIMPGEKKAILTPSQRNLYKLIDQFKVLVEMSNNLSTEDSDSYFNDLKSNLLSSLRDTGGKIASLLTELNLDSEEFDNYLLEL